MNKNYLIDYSLCLIAKSVSSIIRFIPLHMSIYLSRSMGALAFYCFRKKRNAAYKNIKLAFPQYSYSKINSIAKKAFMGSAQHFMEIFYLPWIDEKYIKKFIEFDGLDEVSDIIKDKKGAIFLGLHEGSWEVASVILSRIFKQYNYTVLVRNQPRTPLLDNLLNKYRAKNYCGVIEIKDNLRELVNHLKKGFALGMAADHGGQEGIFINFFGRLALTPVGAVRLALKLDAHIIVGFIKRRDGPRHKIMLSLYDLVKTENVERDLKINLENINRKYEEYIAVSPQEYLWFFKRWKYSPQRNILVLSDGKAGHLKQSLALLDLIKGMPFQVRSDILEVNFKNRYQKANVSIGGLFFNKAGSTCLRKLFSPADFGKISSNYYDAVISCGSGLSVINKIIASQNMAKSIVIMRPGIFSLKRFDLVIFPEHDKAIRSKNVVYIKGALCKPPDANKEEIKEVMREYGLDRDSLSHPVIGLILGGDNKYLSFDAEVVKRMITFLKQSLDFLGGTLLVSTSRRTPLATEQLLKEQLKNYPRCRMFIIANEFNPSGAFEAILSCSDILIISGDSISMISEAVNAAKYTLVFKLKRKRPNFLSKHEKFIEDLENDRYVYVVSETDLSHRIADIWKNKPPIKKLDNRDIILDRLKNIL